MDSIVEYLERNYDDIFGETGSNFQNTEVNQMPYKLVGHLGVVLRPMVQEIHDRAECQLYEFPGGVGICHCFGTIPTAPFATRHVDIDDPNWGPVYSGENDLLYYGVVPFYYTSPRTGEPVLYDQWFDEHDAMAEEAWARTRKEAHIVYTDHSR